MQTVKIATPQNISIDYAVAGLGERILGRLIDLAIFILLYFLLIIVAGIAATSGVSKNPLFIMSIYLFFFGFYDLACEIFFNGQSIGKRVMKIRVISLDGSRPGIGQYLLRWVFRIVDFGITFQLGGLIAVASTQNKQRIGDIVAGTTLVRTEPQTQYENLIFVPTNSNYQPVYTQVIHLTDEDILLVNNVLDNYTLSRNNNLLYKMAQRIKDHLGIKAVNYADDLTFLETIVSDYNHLVVRGDNT